MDAVFDGYGLAQIYLQCTNAVQISILCSVVQARQNIILMRSISSQMMEGERMTTLIFGISAQNDSSLGKNVSSYMSTILYIDIIGLNFWAVF
jgi:hypothetical protein